MDLDTNSYSGQGWILIPTPNQVSGGLITNSYSGQWWILIPTSTQVSGGSGYQLPLLRSVVDLDTNSYSSHLWTCLPAPAHVIGGPVHQLLLRSVRWWTLTSAPSQVSGGPVHQLLLIFFVDLSTSSCSCQWRTRTPFSCHRYLALKIILPPYCHCQLVNCKANLFNIRCKNDNGSKEILHSVYMYCM